MTSTTKNTFHKLKAIFLLLFRNFLYIVSEDAASIFDTKPLFIFVKLPLLGNATFIGMSLHDSCLRISNLTIVALLRRAWYSTSD